ncbi:MAG TPA: ATP-binding protein, partial [Segetibacter sp.]|nr:ATP-binding protein [Segetibacter sp.]
YVASHDLQEPLRKILMHTDLLLISEKDQFSPKGKELIEKISSSAAKLKNLIKDILTYSTINPEKAKETVDLGTLLKEVTVDLEYSISKNNATIHFDHLPSASVFPSQIKQLFQNLISNSVKFSKKETPPVITIRHKFIGAAKVAGYQIIPASKYLQIEVSDNGIGFNKDESQEIFSLFKRLHSQKEFEGSGLGLAICKKVVENHGGIIEAVSKAGEGANFRIILPQ